MKKKILGIKIGSIFVGLLCLVVAFVFWFFVKYADIGADPIISLSAISGEYEH